MSFAKPESTAGDRVEAMRRDAVLPGDVVVPAGGPRPAQRVLLTGATGFLGREVLRELLLQGLEVHCLIRASEGGDPAVRLAVCLDDGRVVDPRLRARAHAVQGDTSQPRLGLGDAYDVLAQAMDAIYHCAAEVSWVKSYALLRRTNVLAALEVVRFACAARAKPVTFVSSLAVCFTGDAARSVDEATDMLPRIGDMPLGYAQSKCVAEALLRAAAARGLPVTIVRPGLLAGDTVSGRSNPGDVLSALLEGCVARGVALDIDWLVDSIPVDYCARAVVALGASRAGGFEVAHVRHTRPRHWRELVLWLNLFGYPVRLISTALWNREMFAAEGRGGPLSSYRRFFMGTGEGPAPFEAYIAAAQARVDCGRSRTRLAALGVEEPALDTPLLRRYVDHYAKIGALPAHRWGTAIREIAVPDPGLRSAVAESLDAHAGLGWEPLRFDASAGILNEIASIRLGAQVGMSRYRLTRPGVEGGLDMVVKVKARDTVLQELLAEIAASCEPALGRAVRAFPQALGLRRSHLREAALYMCAPAAVAARMPRCYGVSEDATRGRWSVAMEHLASAQFIDGSRWSVRDVDTAVDAAASIHSAWYRQIDALLSRPWAAPEVTGAQAAAMAPLWHGLADFAAPWFDAWAGPHVARAQRAFIADIGRWWSELACLPRSLIHNDFNFRNIAIRGGEVRGVTVLDWELARIGVPQHDLAELLCFALPAGAGRAELERWLEMHRAGLAMRSGMAVAREPWRRGFALALRQLLVERLPLYTVIHRFKPQPFMPRVLRNWARLYELAESLERAPQAA